MPRQNCRTGREAGRGRAEAAAQAIIAQGRDMAARAALALSQQVEEDMPMRRYQNPIPTQQTVFCPVPVGGSEADLERILESLATQNQLLLDIQAAINALTAAVLASQCQR